MSFFAQRPEPITKPIDDDKRSNGRKPRVCASFAQPTEKNPYPVDFCIWLQQTFDEVIDLNESVKASRQHHFYSADLVRFVRPALHLRVRFRDRARNEGSLLPLKCDAKREYNAQYRELKKNATS